MSIASILFAVFGLSFLIFIHELGHYFMAKRAGMKIEVFSIGMGKPLFFWNKNGVRWQICYLLFGGFVKIAGMEPEDGKEPYQVQGGFYSKKPMDRLLVAAAGPFVNIVFAMIIFSGIYFAGGQMKPFSQYTSLIGKVDEQSALYSEGIRDGDQVISIDEKPYEGFRDVVVQGMLKNKGQVNLRLKSQENGIVNTKVALYSPDKALVSDMFPKEWKSMGILSAASYIISDGFDPLSEKYAPLKDSTIKKGDRIVYLDGNIIISVSQLSEIVNSDIALVTVLRDGKKVHEQVPRVLLGDLKLSDSQKDEFVDYKREMDLDGAIASTYFIPFLISDGLTVKEELSLIEETNQNHFSLQKGDKILAVSGVKVHNAKEFFDAVSVRKCLIMVSSVTDQKTSWTECDGVFFQSLDKNAIAALENTIGEEVSLKDSNYRFLEPTEPILYKNFLEKSDPQALKTLEGSMDKDVYAKKIEQKTLFSGLLLKDQKVVYNPGPFLQAKDVINDIIFSLKGVLTGSISPKHMSGPIGMVKIVHDGSKSSIVTGLYWLGMISLNLGFMNLLPIPVLDGGHICFTMYEVVTKKRIKAKTMQRMVVPFVALLLVFFAYVTFYDMIKVFG